MGLLTAAALLALAALLLNASVVVLILGRRLERVRASRHREATARHKLELELGELRERVAQRDRELRLAASSGQAQAVELERLRAEREAAPLEGRHVAVTTPKADGERTFRGVCVRELEPRGVVLQAAELLEEDVERGRPVVRSRAAGDVVVPVYAWAQVIPPPEPEA